MIFTLDITETKQDNTFNFLQDNEINEAIKLISYPTINFPTFPHRHL